MTKLLTLSDIDVKNKQVFLRVDYNVVTDGKIVDEYRLQTTIPTIKHLLKQGCSLILASHNGRPGGKRVESLSLRPVAKYLPKLIHQDVMFVDDCVGRDVEVEANKLKPGQVMMLENLRFHPGEDSNNKAFARQLASLAQVYVDDAFAFAHRNAASMVGVAKLLPHAAGLLMQNEYHTLSMLMQKPPKPYTAVVGGAKVSGKLEVLMSLVEHVDYLLVGGAMANTFLAAQGYNMHDSLVERQLFDDVAVITKKALAHNATIVLPTDVLVASSVQARKPKTVMIDELSKGDIAFDIGKQTIASFESIIKKSNTIFWNGPVGLSEKSVFAKGSVALAHAIAKADAQTVIGGGDTVAFLDQHHLEHKYSFVSTGGGATLELLAGNKLPGIEVLMQHKLKLQR